MRNLWPCLLLMACADGPADLTVVHDLQLIHAGLAPPQVAPGEASTLTLTLADPQGGGSELMVWPCTDLGEGCVEERGQALEERVRLGSADQGDFGEDLVLELVAEPALAALLKLDPSELPVAPAQDWWILACRPELCPWFEDLRAAPAPGSAADAELRAFLADPVAQMGQVPLDGASLSRRQLLLSDLPVEERNSNPELRLEEGETEVALGEEPVLRFAFVDELPDTVTLDGFTTLGALGPARTDVYDPTFTWYPGEEAGTGRLYVVARDEAGGSGLWRADARVD